MALPGRLTRLATSKPCLLLLLSGFDDYVNMVLEDVTEYEITSEGKRITKLDSILLNGNNVALVRPPCIPHTLRPHLCVAPLLAMLASVHASPRVPAVRVTAGAGRRSKLHGVELTANLTAVRRT